VTLYFPSDFHADNPDLNWFEACGLISIEPVSKRGEEFIRQTGFDDWLFASGERLEQLERKIAEWSLIVDYNPEPDQETLELQQKIGASLNEWKREVGWISKHNYDRTKLEQWRHKFLTDQRYASIT